MGGRRRRVNGASGEAGGRTLHLEFGCCRAWVVGKWERSEVVEWRDCDDALEAIFTRRSRYFAIGSAIFLLFHNLFP
jgi:hypothetical protein